MNEELYGTLIISMGFVCQGYTRESFRGKHVRLHTISGTLNEVKPAYKAWLDVNPSLAGQVDAHFEVRRAIHQDEL